MIRVCIVEDQTIVRQGLRSLLGLVPDIEVAAEASDGEEAVEVIETHHAGKLDAPYGTALATGRRLAALRRFTYNRPEKVSLEGTRGGEEGGVGVHSLCLPGVVADQEVLFGLAGQTLSIAHRTTSRAAFGPGVLLAIRRIAAEPRFYRGLDDLLGDLEIETLHLCQLVDGSGLDRGQARCDRRRRRTRRPSAPAFPHEHARRYGTTALDHLRGRRRVHPLVLGIWTTRAGHPRSVHAPRSGRGAVARTPHGR